MVDARDVDKCLSGKAQTPYSFILDRAGYSARSGRGVLELMVSPFRAKNHEAPKTQPTTLKGWQQISAFLGEPLSVVQRWASDGMPVRKQGRYVETTPEELNAWLGRESGKPVRVATDNTDLAAELKRGLSFVRHEKEQSKAPVVSKRARR